jgi:uncharacterized membrane protein YeiB
MADVCLVRELSAVHPVDEPGPTPLDAQGPGETGSRPQAARLSGVDAARGLALIGMIAVHSFSESGPDGAASGVQVVAAGRSAALFAVLAGVAIAFMTGRRQVVGGVAGRAGAARLLTRAVLICLIGLALGSFDTDKSPGVILVFYAVLFALAVPLVFLPSRLVLAVGVTVAVVMPVVSHAVRGHLPVPLGTDPSFVSLAEDPVTVLRELVFTGNYPVATWMTYVCVGLVVGRLELSSRRVALQLAAAGVGIAVLGYWASWFLMHPVGGLARLLTLPDYSDESVTQLLTVGAGGVLPPDSWWWLAVLSPHSGTTPELAQSTGVALAVIGVMCVLAGLAGPAGRGAGVLTAPLVAIGSMTLTFYSAHVLFLFSPFSEQDSVAPFLLELLAYALFAMAWRHWFRRGPLEALVGRAAGRAGRWAAGRGATHPPGQHAPPVGR